MKTPIRAKNGRHGLLYERSGNAVPQNAVDIALVGDCTLSDEHLDDEFRIDNKLRRMGVKVFNASMPHYTSRMALHSYFNAHTDGLRAKSVIWSAGVNDFLELLHHEHYKKPPYTLKNVAKFFLGRKDQTIGRFINVDPQWKEPARINQARLFHPDRLISAIKRIARHASCNEISLSICTIPYKSTDVDEPVRVFYRDMVDRINHVIRECSYPIFDFASMAEDSDLYNKWMVGKEFNDKRVYAICAKGE